jgi:hypothetical protein
MELQPESEKILLKYRENLRGVLHFIVIIVEYFKWTITLAVTDIKKVEKHHADRAFFISLK